MIRTRGVKESVVARLHGRGIEVGRKMDGSTERHGPARNVANQQLYTS
ncbi:predicted protein [Plenodomus lingam JN3]|uniref:Predicted protein n=1 Tax=Leptosphaeria maculans (strain JN3 / isolate v23.1.3 / race Av1-4-5-6-7-8) TaxID=985895 RepID=E4ZQL3_LEPMJ|nr:predicted protein [Plenodomus lingam JN3]CBX94018.1 predicted protein [Plenodomus lingam JN3]